MARGKMTRAQQMAQYALDAEQHVLGGGDAQKKRVAAAQAALAAALGSSSEAKSVEQKHEAQASEGSVTQLEAKPEPMAALCTQITEAVAKAAELQVAKALSSLLSQVAKDYDLDFEELKTKYLGDKAPKARKAPVKAKVTKVEVDSDEDGPPQCIALTKKGDRCKCKPRNGAYGVMSWADAARTITGVGQVDNATVAVASADSTNVLLVIVIIAPG